MTSAVNNPYNNRPLNGGIVQIPLPTSSPPAPAAPQTLASSSGLWVGAALLGGILVSGTRVAPIAFGILTIGLIYQLNAMLSGTPVPNATASPQYTQGGPTPGIA
jgi:hypothetical protein